MRCFSIVACLVAGSLAFAAATPLDRDGGNHDFAADEQALKTANIKTDSASLLALFRRRTLNSGERSKVQNLVAQLGSDSYKMREQAATELLARGPAALEILRTALKSADLEVVRRAEKCMARIQETDFAVDVPAAAIRLLAARKTPGAIATLLDYLPFADNDIVADEVRNALAALGVKDGKPDPVLLAALTDNVSVRRAAAGEALLKSNLADAKPAVRKLLGDSAPFVRFRIAMALVQTKDRDAVPVLIDALPQLTLADAWQAEDVLYRLAEDKNPPDVALGNNDAARKKCRDAWARWWKDHGAAVDLARLNQTPRQLGLTLLVLLDENQIMEVGPDRQPRWKLGNIVFPLDAQALPGGNILAAEYHASRVAERNQKGDVVWEKRIVGPLVAQRLRNGNTFISTDTLLLEVDPKGKEVMYLTIPGERIMKAVKTQRGEIVCLTNEARVVRLDSAGKEIVSFPVALSQKLFGGRIDVLPNGHVLVPHNGENKVVEYNGTGKAVWELPVDQPIAATRLPNGHTLVTSMSSAKGAMEFDRRGKLVWQFTSNGRVTRALRR